MKRQVENVVEEGVWHPLIRRRGVGFALSIKRLTLDSPENRVVLFGVRPLRFDGCFYRLRRAPGVLEWKSGGRLATHVMNLASLGCPCNAVMVA